MDETKVVNHLLLCPGVSGQELKQTMLLQSGHINEALQHVIGLNANKIVRLLLRAKADIHAEDDKALRNAVLFGNVEVVKILLEANADVHARDDEALLTSMRDQKTDVVTLLLEHGATSRPWWVCISDEMRQLDMQRYFF